MKVTFIVRLVPLSASVGSLVVTPAGAGAGDPTGCVRGRRGAASCSGRLTLFPGNKRTCSLYYLINNYCFFTNKRNLD